MDPLVSVLHHNGGVYVEVGEFVDAMVQDLLRAPKDMVATRTEIIYALQRYAAAAKAHEE